MSAPQPARGRPHRTVLEGRYARLEPIGLSHASNLLTAASPERYRWLFDAPPANLDDMRSWVTEKGAADDPLMFAVVDRATNRAAGRQSLMRIVPEHGVIEIGNILWGDPIARSRVTTEAVYLFACHVFDDLGYRRFEWKCNALNEPSRRAAARFGFVFEGIFRKHMIIKGENRDTAWFSIIDDDWPRLRAGYERWLDPANFDAGGIQKSKLTFG
jgi:RimJ/RimL family protein N-acetyltransferase